MPGVAAAVRKNRKHGHGHEGEVSKHREKVREFFDIASLEKTSRGCSREESLRHEAAREIQRSAMHNGLIAPTIGLNRVVLLERLDLELQLRRGLAQLALCLILFSLVAYSSVLEKVSVQRLGMLNVYKTLFQLDDSLAEIRTIEGLRDYMTEVSVQSHLLQPLSSIYFKDSEGEVRIMPGIRGFDEPLDLSVADMSVKVDTPEFSITAWVQVDPDMGSYIIRKPLGTEISDAYT